jgi:hypothetical protein
MYGRCVQTGIQKDVRDFSSNRKNSARLQGNIKHDGNVSIGSGGFRVILLTTVVTCGGN